MSSTEPGNGTSLPKREAGIANPSEDCDAVGCELALSFLIGVLGVAFCLAATVAVAVWANPDVLPVVAVIGAMAESSV